MDSYHTERHPVGARVLKTSMAHIAVRRHDARSAALGDLVAELLRMDEPRRRLAGEMSGLDIRYDLGDGHPLRGRRMPDLDLATAAGPQRLYDLLRRAEPALVNLVDDRFDSGAWSDRVPRVDASTDDPWILPVIGAVDAPPAVLVRPDGHVAWAGEAGQAGLDAALARWFGPP